MSVGATSIPIGAANGTGTIAAGSELLVIQMQDASINVSNTVPTETESRGPVSQRSTTPEIMNS